MAQLDHTTILTSIQTQRDQNPLSVLNLAEPILSNQQQQQPHLSRDSNIDISNNDTSHNTTEEAHLTPSALTADLAHYQSLFSKLRFSYLEQVTKEKYLRSIVGDPPVLVSHEDNMLLEDKLVSMKSDLKAKKEEVNQLVEEMQTLAREVAQRYEGVNAGVSELQRLPQEIEELQRQVEETRQELERQEAELDVDVSDDPRMNLDLQQTMDMVEQQRREAKEVQAKIDALQKDMPLKMRECERAERELEEMESQRNEATRLAREVRRIKEEGGRDLLEEQGRWCKGSAMVLTSLLGVEV